MFAIIKRTATLAALLIGTTLAPAAAVAQFDLVATKDLIIPAGPAYVIKITNKEPAVPGRGRINVIEMLPPGMTVTAINAPGWTCRPMTVVGPDVITCTRLFNGGLPPGDLPAIRVTFQGDPIGRNCVRAKLFRRNPAGTFVLYNEPDLTNNFACR